MFISVSLFSTMKTNSGIACLLSSGHGVYIPVKFIECYDPQQWGITDDDKAELSSPDNQYYWETWESVRQYAVYTDDNGNKWHLSQDDDLFEDNDLFAVCYELLTDDEKQFLGVEE